MNEKDILEISDLLSLPKKIAIIPHRNPDGDAIGSTLALYHFHEAPTFSIIRFLLETILLALLF